MEKNIQETLFELLSNWSGYEFGSAAFLVVWAAALLAGAFVTCWVAGLVGSKRGIILASLAFVVPLLLGLGSYIAVLLYLVPLVAADWALLYLPWVGLGLAILLVILVANTRLLDLGFWRALFVFLLASVAFVGAIYGSGSIIEINEKGRDGMEKRSDDIDERKG